MSIRDHDMKENAGKFARVLELVTSVLDSGDDALPNESVRALREVNSSTRAAVNPIIKLMNVGGTTPNKLLFRDCPSIADVLASTLDTSQLKSLSFMAETPHDNDTLNLVELPLKKLERLDLANPRKCSRLAQANWPNLKTLKLRFEPTREETLSNTFDEHNELSQWRNVKWPLEALDIDFEEAMWEIDLAPAMEMLKAFPKLKTFDLYTGTNHAVAMVQKIVEAPLEELQSFDFFNSECEVEGIPSVLATANWPRLEHLSLGHVYFNDKLGTEALASAAWFKGLKSLSLKLSFRMEPSAFRTLLRGLEGGPLETLYIESESLGLLRSFERIRLPNLKRLEMCEMNCDLGNGPLEALFSARMPALEYLEVSYVSTHDMPAVLNAPVYDGHIAFGKLKELVLGKFTFSEEVLDYFGNLNEEHKWKIKLVDCEAPLYSLPEEYTARLRSTKTPEQILDMVLEKLGWYERARYFGNLEPVYWEIAFVFLSGVVAGMPVPLGFETFIIEMRTEFISKMILKEQQNGTITDADFRSAIIEVDMKSNNAEKQ